MRVAVFSRAVLSHSTGGLAVAAWNICRTLADASHDVTLFTTRTDTFAGEHEAKGVKCLYLENTTPCKYEGGYYNMATAAFWPRHTSRPFDAVVSISKAAMELFKGGTVARPPMLFTDHGIGLDRSQDTVNYGLVYPDRAPQPESEILEGIRSTYTVAAPDIQCTEAQFYAKWDAVAGVSLSACMDLQVRIAHPRVYFLPNPVYDVDWTKPPKGVPARGTMKIGMCAGDLTAANKGIAAGLAMLKDQTVEVHLFGRNGGKLKAMAERYAAVVDHGYLQQPEVLAQLAQMDVVFDPSTHHSGLNMVVSQSLASGVPVIAYPFGGMSTAIHSGVNGFLVAPGAQDQMAAALKYLRWNRPQMSVQAYEHANRLFSPAATGKFYTQALGNLTHREPSPSALSCWRWS